MGPVCDSLHGTGVLIGVNCIVCAACVRYGLDEPPSRGDRSARTRFRGTPLAVLNLLSASDPYGPEPSSPAVAESWSASIGAQRRQALVEVSINREEAAAQLGVSAQAVSAMIKRGDLAGLKVAREWRLPRWQFDPDSESGLLPGLRAVLEASPGSLVALSRWIQTETADLGGLTPRSALQNGQSSHVLRLLRAISARRSFRKTAPRQPSRLARLDRKRGRHPLGSVRLARLLPPQRSGLFASSGPVVTGAYSFASSRVLALYRPPFTSAVTAATRNCP